MATRSTRPKQDGDEKDSKKKDTAIGCGCLGLILLAVLGLVGSCLGGESDEPEASRSLTGPVPTSVASGPAFVDPLPLPTSTSVTGPTTSRRATTSTRLRPTTTTTPGPRPRPEPDPDPDPQPQRRATTTTRSAPADDGGSVYYANCAAVQAAGQAPIRRGDPGYRPGLDRDGDGEGCAGD